MRALVFLLVNSLSENSKMNSKIILGIIIILGTLNESFSLIMNFQRGVSQLNPIYVILVCMPFIALRIYLIRKGREKKSTFELTKTFVLLQISSAMLINLPISHLI